MEDEDGESKVMDMWSILGKQQLKDTSIGNSLKSSIDNAYADVIEEEKQLLQYNSVAIKDSPSKNNSTGSKIIFKGFKKRILAQAQETQTNTLKSVAQEQQSLHTNASSKSSKEKRAEIKRGKITEYAQYLGLQPSSKNKCSKCQSSSNLCSTLKQSSCTCNTAMTPMPSTSESSTVPQPPNFKITRKVYLCAACGTYFENWNLFLHMRDIHKRHICLFCLGMFGQAERLSHHLAKKHGVPEMAFTSVEDFYGAFKGSCYLVCCTCEKVFSETDNFYNHFCSPTSRQDLTASICTLCRQTGTHASTCSLAVETSKEVNSTSPPTTQSGVISAHVLDKSVNSGSKTIPRKVVKNNRSKYVEDVVSSPHKLNAHTKKTNSKVSVSQFNESQVIDETLNRDESPQNEIAHDVSKDTVSETIMEVSKYIEDTREEKEEINEREDCQNNSELNSSDTPSHSIPYDSVTETIMEVSRCTNNIEEFDHTINKEDMAVTDTSNASDKSDLDIEEADKPNNETLNSSEETNIGVDDQNSVDHDAEENVAEEKTIETELESTDSNSHVSESPPESPVMSSMFSPQHEAHVSDEQSKEKDVENDDKENVDTPNESQSSVTYKTSETSDRSLVIKICTNRNSQFSVATNSDNVENDVSQKSEENNNADSSLTEDKESNIFEKERDNSSSYQANEEDSDSDSFKLAVVDSSNTEEHEEIEETSDSKGVTEDNTELNMSIENNENQTELAEEKEIDVDENGQQDEETKDDSRSPSQIQSTEEAALQPYDGIVLAGEDVPCIDLNVDGILDTIEIDDLLKRCIESASPFCVYCNHARHIAANGKQLGLHMLAEHKFQPQHPAIIIQADQFVARVKKSLDELDTHFFNLDSYSSTNGTYNVPDERTYECFHCRFHSAVHKELYLHNRKMHQKTILICIMCKSTFYSYSELLCHLCPGIYSPNINVKYRCCLCPTANLPSAFRLMVHLRKRHHACDVCLESTGNQQRLSNHVWKHKLHHLCYRCGIAYRNKPDITKHLFWKHGTESVLCKKCLQKKWPHIYHFCIPPTAFVCEECGSSFSRAVALKVHKRLHSGDRPYACSDCSERFISRKLLTKHENLHKEPPAINATFTDTTNQQPVIHDENSDKEKIPSTDGNATVPESMKEAKEPVKKVVDVYDLPPLNLSSESDTDSEDEKPEAKEPENTEKDKSVEENVMSPVEQPKSVSSDQVTESIVEVEQNDEEKEQGAQIMDGIWDNFKTYTASLEMKDSSTTFTSKELEAEPELETDVAFLRSIVLADHDYCVVWSDKEKGKETGSKENEKEEANTSGDQECLNKAEKSPADGNGNQNVVEDDPSKKKVKSPKKKKQGGSTSSSDSSSDSDSSSCSCGTNCSCSSSSSGSSSSSSSSSDSDSSTSEGSPKKQSSRRERKKEKESAHEPPENEIIDLEGNKEISIEMENGAAIPAEPAYTPQLLVMESDLETEETETDEDFYDEHPQQLANKLLAEKRNQLMLLAAVAPASTESAIPLNNGLADTDTAAPSPDPVPAATEEDQTQQKRKVKTKKRKKGERTKQRNATPTVESIKLNIPKAFYQKNPGYLASSPALMQSSMTTTPTNDVHGTNVGLESQSLGTPGHNIGGSGSEAENKRSSKRKRVPKRFYGDSSDDEAEKQPTVKWRKVETPSFAAVPSVKSLPPRLPLGGKNMSYRPPETQSENLGVATASASESEEPADSSSDSSDSEVEASQQVQTHPTESVAPVPERQVNLYCYCQCPYDEVSEMIACDAQDCRIEWFHFECVGIMVPPKGKWYCPDCRKKHDLVQNSEDYFD